MTTKENNRRNFLKKGIAGVYWIKEGEKPIKAGSAVKWVLQNENVHTVISGFSTFDQMKEDVAIMEDITLTPEENASLERARITAGMYCQQCGKCVTQCKENFDIPTIMRSYMYAFGYKCSSAAKETLLSLRLPEIPCKRCDVCTVDCISGFDVKSKVLKISRILNVPDEFLV